MLMPLIPVIASEVCLNKFPWKSKASLLIFMYPYFFVASFIGLKKKNFLNPILPFFFIKKKLFR